MENVIVEEETDLEPENSAEEVRGSRVLIKKSKNKQTMHGFSKQFPNFVSLNKEEKAAFFEALTMARQNVEKQGVIVGEQFEIIHDEYLKFYEEDLQEASSSETFYVDKATDVEDKVGECTTVLQVTVNEKRQFTRDSDEEVVNLFMKNQKRKEAKAWLKDQVEENEAENSDEEFQLMDPKSGCVMMVLQNSTRKKYELMRDISKFELGVKSTPKFDALNFQEKEIFFDILKQAHDNILEQNAGKEEDILPFEAFLKIYEKDKDVAVFPTAVENFSKSSESEKEKKDQPKTKNLKLNLKLISGDNERLEKSVRKMQEPVLDEDILPPETKKPPTSEKISQDELVLCRNKDGGISTGDECLSLEKIQDAQDTEKSKPKEERIIKNEAFQSPKKFETKPKDTKKEKKQKEKKQKAEEKLREELRRKEEAKKKMQERNAEKKLREEELMREEEKLRQEKERQEEERRREEEKLPRKVRVEEDKFQELENEENEEKMFHRVERPLNAEKIELGLSKIEEFCANEKLLREERLAQLRAEGKFDEEARLRSEYLQNEELCKEEKRIHKKRLKLEEKLIEERIKEEKILREKSRLLDKLLQNSSKLALELETTNDKLQNRLSDKKLKERDEKKNSDILKNTKSDQEKSQKSKKGANQPQTITYTSRGVLDNMKKKENSSEIKPNSQRSLVKEEKPTSGSIEQGTLSELKDSLDKVMKKMEKMEELLEEQKDQQKKLKKYKKEIEELKVQPKKIKKIKQEKIKKTGMMTKVKVGSSQAKEMDTAQEVMVIIEQKDEFFYKGVMNSPKNSEDISDSENEYKNQKVEEDSEEVDAKIQKEEEEIQTIGTTNEKLPKNEIKEDASGSLTKMSSSTTEEKELTGDKQKIIKEIQLKQKEISVLLKKPENSEEKTDFFELSASETSSSIQMKTFSTEKYNRGKKGESCKGLEIKIRKNLSGGCPIREVSSVKTSQRKNEGVKIEKWKSELLQTTEGKSLSKFKKEYSDEGTKVRFSGAYLIPDMYVRERQKRQNRETEIKKLKSETTQTMEESPSFKKLKNVQSGATQTPLIDEKVTFEAYPIQKEDLPKVKSFVEQTPKLEKKMGKIVIVGDDVIEKIQNLILDLEKKAKRGNIELENEYLQLVLGYIDYLSKILGTLIEQNRKQFKVKTVEPINVHWEYDEQTKAKRVPSFTKSLSDMNIDIYAEKTWCCRNESGTRRFRKSKSLEKFPLMKSSIALMSISYSGSSLDSKETEEKIGVSNGRVKRNSEAKFSSKREKYSNEGIYELHKSTQNDFFPNITSSIEDSEDSEYIEKARKQKLLKTFVKLCGCGKAESLENLKRKGMESPETRRRPETAFEMFKAAERKKMTQSYRKD